MVLTNSKREKKKKLKAKKIGGKFAGKGLSQKKPLKVKKMVVAVRSNLRGKYPTFKKGKKKKFPGVIGKSKKLRILMPAKKPAKKALSRRSQYTHESSASTNLNNKRYLTMQRPSLTSIGSGQSFGQMAISKTADSDYFNIKRSANRGSRGDSQVIPTSEYFPCQRLLANPSKFASIGAIKGQRLSHNSIKQKKMVLNRVELKKLRNGVKKSKTKKRVGRKALSKPRKSQGGGLERVVLKVAKVVKKGHAKKASRYKVRQPEPRNEQEPRNSGWSKGSLFAPPDRASKKSYSPFGKKHF